ncbi:GMP synthase-like glutamine amidotransferase [Crossiella equi]|uniref:GMP synthase-like glutamine amidotransferase n=1 Tax=Crossiella equi TaxID=130796 RepID=A0ABS5AB92_9PSEU|nr:type 1 glutamine amidotransferase [Crossiella equi]MBP2473858.1 GMP synthase-like glutamine amidotransferase [Crossiella equi]
MTSVLVLQPSELAPLGTLADWLMDAGADIQLVRCWADPIPSTVEGHRALVCLGGEMGALDDLQHPWLKDVRALLSHAVSKQVPVLGVCLGAQLLAVATGGQVRPGEAGPEVGTLLVAKRDAAGGDPLFDPMPMTPDVLQFHSDEIHVLPPGATLLASSPKYPHQAFRVGNSAYGVQFHIETTPEIIQTWVEHAPEEAGFAPRGHFEDEHLLERHQDFAEVWQPFTERFVHLAAGDLGQAAPGRRLPLV